jgi:signal transduction histidine kinase
VRAAGVAVDLRVEGSERTLPIGLDLSAYRIVQEAMTNALKHAAGGRVGVTIRYLADAVEVEVVDDGRGAGTTEAGSGHGLVGMRERVAMYGGRLDAGQQTSGGWRIAAHLPVGPL